MSSDHPLSLVMSLWALALSCVTSPSYLSFCLLFLFIVDNHLSNVFIGCLVLRWIIYTTSDWGGSAVILWVCSEAFDELKTTLESLEYSGFVKVFEVSDTHSEDFMLKNEVFQHNWWIFSPFVSEVVKMQFISPPPPPPVCFSSRRLLFRRQYGNSGGPLVNLVSGSTLC